MSRPRLILVAEGALLPLGGYGNYVWALYRDTESQATRLRQGTDLVVAETDDLLALSALAEGMRVLGETLAHGSAPAEIRIHTNIARIRTGLAEILATRTTRAWHTAIAAPLAETALWHAIVESVPALQAHRITVAAPVPVAA